MDNFDVQLIKWITSDAMEGKISTLAKDRGGLTYMGLSSRIYPWVESYVNSEGRVPYDKVQEVYYTDYLTKIYGYEYLKSDYTWLVPLLFAGKVHGVGDEHYVEVIQQSLNDLGYFIKVDGFMGHETLSALKLLSTDDRDSLRRSVWSSREILADKRALAVGAYPDSIKARVGREFAHASVVSKALTNSESVVVAVDNMSVVAHAKLSSVLATDNSVGLEIVSSDGWEQLPLGLDVTIEIRGVHHASNTIPSRTSFESA